MRVTKHGAIYLAVGITARSRRTVIGGWRFFGGVEVDGPSFNDARQVDRQSLLNYAEHLRLLVERGGLANVTAK